MSSDDVDSMSSSGSSSPKRWKDSTAAKDLRGAGRSLSSSGQSMLDSSRDEAASKIGPVSYRKGGKTRRDGPANLHKAERIIPANKRKKVERLMKREKMSLTNRKGKKRSKKRSSGRS